LARAGAPRWLGLPRRFSSAARSAAIIERVVKWWSFLAVAVPLVLTPGASTAVVLRNSLSGGVRGGLETAVGANAGSVCFGLLCAGGFSLALARWPQVWVVLRVAGCLYLAWLGLQSLRRAIAASPLRPSAPKVARADARYAREGFITNVSNPALATFYFLVLPQFIVPGASIARAALLLTAAHVALAFSWHAAWAAAGGTLSHVLASGWPRRVLDLAAGLALVGLAYTIVA
jgi:threonine/homoserine/homoserine lactone efflux protein